MPTSELSAGELVDRHHPQSAVVKRKRTKRPRHHPPASSSASSSESTTTEEEDMAHCLILLAQGGAVDSKPSPSPSPAPPRSERYTSRKYTEAVATEDGVKAGFYVYECKTCNKCFPTFQALGGHRASHKKPRAADEIAATNVVKQQQQQQKPPTTAPPVPLLQPHQTTTIAVAMFPDVTTALSLNTVAPTTTTADQKLRVHECSICGAEFASGQALGGHMRRHRPLNAPERAVTAIAAADATKKEPGINLELDLNLPAPSDEEPLSLPPATPAVVLDLGQFISDGNKAGGLMLTASPLVDCHY